MGLFAAVFYTRTSCDRIFLAVSMPCFVPSLSDVPYIVLYAGYSLPRCSTTGISFFLSALTDE